MRLIAHYTTFCFCEKPELPTMKFKEVNGFKKAVQEYCKKHGLQFSWVKQDYSGRVAGAVLPFSCNHFKKQEIRIELKYTEAREEGVK